MKLVSAILALLILATFQLLRAHSYIISGTEATKGKVFGRLVCSSSGNHVLGVDGFGVAGATVALTCNRSRLRNVGHPRTTTNMTGVFKLLLQVSAGGHFDPSAWDVCVELQVSKCPLLPSHGILRAPIRVVNRVAQGSVAMFEVGSFRFRHLFDQETNKHQEAENWIVVIPGEGLPYVSWLQNC